MEREGAGGAGTDWKCQPIKVFRHPEAEDKPLLKRALSMDPGSPSPDGLQAELGKLRLLLCNAEVTLAQAQERVGRADSLEIQVEDLQAQLGEARSLEGAAQQATSPASSKGSSKAGRLRKDLQALRRDHSTLQEQMATLQASYAEEKETSARLRRVNLLAMARVKELQGSSSGLARGSGDQAPEEKGVQCSRGREADEGQLLAQKERLSEAQEELRRAKEELRTEAQSHQEAKVRAEAAHAEELRALERELREENRARLEEAKSARDSSRYARDWISIKRDQFVVRPQPPGLRIKAIHGAPKAHQAHVVLVMRGDAYALGACVVASRIRSLGTKADVVCMVTEDVGAGATEALAEVFDVVYQVPYIEYSCERMTTRKQQAYYESWIAQSFTKWNVLGLTAYQKVLLVDADLLPMENLDELFGLRAPAATFSSPWSKACKEDGYEDPYVGLKHGSQVQSHMIQQAVRDSLAHAGGGKGSYVALGSLVLLEPSVDVLYSLKAFISARQPFGVPGLHSGFDEQCLVLFYNLHCPHHPWMHISQVWNSLAWHEKWLAGETPKAYHFFNDKPWTMSPAKYPDLKIWYSAAEDLRRNYPGAANVFDLCLGNPRFMDEFKELQAQMADAPQPSSKWSEEEALMSPLSAEEMKMSWSDLDEMEETKKRDEAKQSPAAEEWKPASQVIIAQRTTVKSTTTPGHREQPLSLRPNANYKVHARHGPAPLRFQNKGNREPKARSPERWTRKKTQGGSPLRQEISKDSDVKGFSGGHWQRVGGEKSKREVTHSASGDHWQRVGGDKNRRSEVTHGAPPPGDQWQRSGGDKSRRGEATHGAPPPGDQWQRVGGDKNRHQATHSAGRWFDPNDPPARSGPDRRHRRYQDRSRPQKERW
ncbi:hypothetical protein BSKO_03566 [Bryopsis sp. KO-2023]|nr:hypothetical protein BSKO_03566 [Bryopsis sp. KO-2023]